MHFAMKLFLAAPWSGLPPALTVLLSQDCAATVLTTKQLIKAATTITFIVSLFHVAFTTEIPRSFGPNGHALLSIALQLDLEPERP